MELNWCIELYKDFDVYVLVILCVECKFDKGGQGLMQWDFVVCICELGVDLMVVEIFVVYLYDECLLFICEVVEEVGLVWGYGLIDELFGCSFVQQLIDF